MAVEREAAGRDEEEEAETHSVACYIERDERVSPQTKNVLRMRAVMRRYGVDDLLATLSRFMHSVHPYANSSLKLELRF